MWPTYLIVHYMKIVQLKDVKKTLQFVKDLNDRYAESLFQKRVERSGFNSLDEWAEKSQTAALIFIRRETILFEKYFN